MLRRAVRALSPPGPRSHQARLTACGRVRLSRPCDSESSRRLFALHTDDTLPVAPPIVVIDPIYSAQAFPWLHLDRFGSRHEGWAGARLVPVELAASGDEGAKEISLRCTVDEVNKLEPVHEFAYLRLGGVPCSRS